MIRILIVDDEPNLVEGLAGLLLSVLGNNVEIYKGYSCKDAFSIINSAAIDLILLDVQMPKMNGIEFLQYIEEDNPMTKVIILTSHDTFAWIQEALRHPCCVDYILKMQGDEKIIAAVKKQIKAIEETNNPQSILARVLENSHDLAPIISSHHMRKWLYGNEQILASKDIGLDSERCTNAFLIHRCETGDLHDMFSSGLQHLFFEQFGSNCSIQILQLDWEEYAVFIQGREMLDYPYIRARLVAIQEKLRELSESVDLCFHENSLFVNDTTGMNSLRTSIREMHLALGNYCKLNHEIIICLDRIQQQETNDEKEMISRIKKHIMEHLSDSNLSLSMLAELTFYSPTYLSRLFKQETGDTLSNYITNARIKESCRLLEQGTITAKKIGQAVGFESAGYFSTFFKRITGMTPLQYQHSHIKEHEE